ncbi:MAG TPA: glycogen/starch/alpha-glucan phosphorylase [Capsulimonadaceae bacterium]|jgi:starch phosphorylase
MTDTTKTKATKKATAKPTAPTLGRLGTDELRDLIKRKIRYVLGESGADLTPDHLFQAIAHAVRDRLIDGMLATEKRYHDKEAKRLYYLSMEFLIGRSLGNSLNNMGLMDVCRDAVAEFGINLEDALEAESDAALGNGGLGRLAACFLDSLATLGMPGFGYGINYEYGLFRQEIDNGYQVEKPDSWRAYGTPWQVEHPSEAVIVPLYGKIEHGEDRLGHYNPMWMDWKVLIGVPADMPVVGYDGTTVNYLRLYSARSSQDFDMTIFNMGDYIKAVEQKISSETISKVLYPSDAVIQGRELRLIQEYFLVACSLRDIIRRYQQDHTDFTDFAKHTAIQLNDTHPALMVAELMRFLIDEEEMFWDDAWAITQATLGYTNHTLMPEALEKWPMALVEYVLPRHLQIILEINRRFVEAAAAKRPGDTGFISRLSLIEEGPEKKVRMANLAIVGSHSVNGVSALHSELLKTTLAADFVAMFPKRFNNKTNGVTQRRWLLSANPPLAKLITETLGNGWTTNLDELRGLEKYLDDKSFQEEFAAAKRASKERLAKRIKEQLRLTVSPDSLFDIQVKRFHEYKRQLLNLMHIVHLYLSIVDDGKTLVSPRVFVFAGKAAPGYWAAKHIIKLINSVAYTVNNDKRVGDQLKVVFLPDYRVSLAEVIIPAANISEQISTAGTEASGTGNMKFQLNGALTMGTLDGANVEILEEVGDDNIFIFGLKTPEVQRMQLDRSYHPWQYLEDRRLSRVMAAIAGGRFSPKEPSLFRGIHDSIMGGDPYFLLADLGSYIDAQEKASAQYLDQSLWSRKSALNVARSGKFSSDRTIQDYADEIWDIKRQV